MFEASKLFLYCLNMWRFETSSAFNKHLKQMGNNGEPLIGDLDVEFRPDSLQHKISSLYKLNFTRWMCYNFVPSFCETLDKYETVLIFGISFLRIVFTLVRQELIEKFTADKDKIPSEKRTLVWTYLPK